MWCRVDTPCNVHLEISLATYFVYIYIYFIASFQLFLYVCFDINIEVVLIMGF